MTTRRGREIEPPMYFRSSLLSFTKRGAKQRARCGGAYATVRRKFLLLFIFRVGSGAAAADEYDNGDKTYIPRPHKVTAVESVVIRANGMWGEHDSSSDETPEQCKQFALTEREVHAYFRHARRVSHANFYHDFEMSRCYATGEVVFANGDHGEWKIDALSRGFMHLDSGINVYLYCPKCKGL